MTALSEGSNDAGVPSLMEDVSKNVAILRDQLAQVQRQADAADSWWSVTNAMTISVTVLAFGLLTMLMTAFLLRRERDSHVVLRTIATILILTFAVFLIVAGYSDRQIAPAMGLLGTVAGYLLGKESRMPRREVGAD